MCTRRSFTQRTILSARGGLHLLRPDCGIELKYREELIVFKVPVLLPSSKVKQQLITCLVAVKEMGGDWLKENWSILKFHMKTLIALLVGGALFIWKYSTWLRTVLSSSYGTCTASYCTFCRIAKILAAHPILAPTAPAVPRSVCTHRYYL